MNVTADTLFSMLEIAAGFQLDILGHRLKQLGYGKVEQSSSMRMGVADKISVRDDIVYMIGHHWNIMRCVSLWYYRNSKIILVR